MRLALVALASFAIALPAHAETLLDNIDGTTLDRQGQVIHFNGMVIGDDGRITQILTRKDKRPKKPDYLIDGKARFVLPGMIDAHVRLMNMALALLSAPARREPLPPPRPEDRDVALGKVQQALAARGVTAVADMGTTIEDWQTYRRAGDTGRLYLRIMAYAADIPAMALIAGPRPTPWLYDDRLRAGGLHIALDGALADHKAALKAPYADAPGAKGTLAYNDIQLRNVMSRAAMDGFQLALDAHGDAAVAQALGAIAELSGTYKGDRRWRIEQVEQADPADFTALAPEGVFASFAPATLAGPGRERIGPTRAAQLQPWQSLARAKVRLTFGSGDALAPQAPLAGIAMAISRDDGQLTGSGSWQAQENIQREAALAAYTGDAADAGFADGRFGRLVVGERADFIVLASDPLLSPASELRQMEVLETWVGGRKIYDAAQISGEAFRAPQAEAVPPAGEQKQLPPPPASSPAAR